MRTCGHMILSIALVALAKMATACDPWEVIALNATNGEYCRAGLTTVPSDVEEGIARPCPYDVWFVVDESGSISDAGWLAIKSFMKSVMATFVDFNSGPNGNHFGAVAFSGSEQGSIPVVNRFNIGSFDTLAEYNAAVDAMPRSKPAGSVTGTCISCGIERALERQVEHENLMGPAHMIDRKKTMFVLTDGVTTPPNLPAQAQADAARAAQFSVFAIGVGPDTSEDELRDIANEPDEVYLWRVADFDQLATLGTVLGVGLECGGGFPQFE